MIVNPGTTTRGAPEKHAAQHAASGSDPVTPESIGAAGVNHSHTATEVGARPDGWTPTAAEIGARPDTWTPTAAEVGAAAANHSHTAAEVGAAAADHTHTAAEVGAAAASHTHTAAQVGAVPTTRKVNGKPLSADVTLAASDVGALPTGGGTLTGNLTIKGPGNFGTQINLGDGDYVHIAEPTDDCLEIKAKKVNFVLSDTSDSKFTINDSPIGGSGAEPGTVTPKAAGTAAVGASAKFAREDHVHPSQTSVSGNAGTATKLATARTIDGVSFNGSAAITHYGTCATAAATAAKTVSCTGFTLVTGARIAVKFTYANTASSPTLNVNGTGAKAIKAYGATAYANLWGAGEVVEFVYDGTNFVAVDGYTAYYVRNHTHNGYVPTTRTINGKALSSNITLTAADLGLSGGGGLTLDRRTLNAGETASVSVSSIGVYLACIGGCEPVVVDVVDIPTGSSCYVKNQSNSSNMARIKKTSTSTLLISNESTASEYVILVKLGEG